MALYPEGGLCQLCPLHILSVLFPGNCFVTLQPLWVCAQNTLQPTGIFILPKLFCLHCLNVTPLQCTYGEV